MTFIVRWFPAIAAAAIGCYLAAIYAACIAQGCTTSRVDLVFMAALALAAAAVSLSVVVRHRFTPNLVLTIVPCFVAIYLFETIASSPSDRHGAEILAEVRKQRARGIDAVPPYGFAAGRGVLLPDGSHVVPLGGPSGRLVVLCQEGARPIASYRGDEFGFNNPPEAWRTETQILFVGDSFTHGACVDNTMHFVHAVRQLHRGTMNLGFSGNGPLIELAGIREYASQLRPRIVFWMYDEANDVLTYSPRSDLDVEIDHPILSKYLTQPGFTQNLYARQEQVNAAVNAAAEAWTSAWMSAPHIRTIKQYLLLPRTREILRNAYIRLRVMLPFVLVREPPLSDERIRQFAEVMRLAANEVQGWGGRLVFVNLPAHLQACLGRDHPSRRAILDVPRQLGLDTIDLEGPMFDLALTAGAHVLAADPPCTGHYSEAAYAIVATVLLDYLRIKDGDALLPSWSEIVRPDGSRQLIYAGRAHDRSKPLRP